MNYKKYERFQTIKLEGRTWPDDGIKEAPIWCSVDLRDGDQALINPMTVEGKLEMFGLLIELGFKKVEVGSPSAFQIEFGFLGALVENNLIPVGVKIQVLAQARPHLVQKTFGALEGVKEAVVHIYDSTSILQRDVVFDMSKDGMKSIAVNGIKLVKEHAKSFNGRLYLKCSPEGFTGTEVDYALEACEAVLDAWETTNENKVVINLPSTVEMDTPNVSTDRIGWMVKNFRNRNRIILSVHPHNDRGAGVAAAELAMLAGADRIGGTLFGSGERTGNVDILNLAYNVFSHGIDPKLQLGNINKTVDVHEKCCEIPVRIRHPYAGELVFTTFSGSHQDAVDKGMKKYPGRNNDVWEAPCLPVDPGGLGRGYETLVRIDSQSGRGGVAFVLEGHFGYKMSKNIHKEFGATIQKVTEKCGEISSMMIMGKFKEEYLDVVGLFKLLKLEVKDSDNINIECQNTKMSVTFLFNREEKSLIAGGNGPIDSLKKALIESSLIETTILDYGEHPLGEESETKAAAYVEVKRLDNSKITFGVRVDSNITIASIKTIFSAVNRLYRN